MTDDDDKQVPGEAPESIWRQLDGSTPVRPQPQATPLSFTKPEPRPLTFPQAPAAAAQAQPPAIGGQPVFVLANWGSRFGAYVIDNILFGIIVFCLTLPAAMALGMSAEEALVFLSGSLEVPKSVDQPALAWALVAAQAIAPPLIAAVFLARWAGQTPGKRLVGLRVVPEDATPMTFGRAFQREVVAKTLIIVPLTGITFGIAFLANYLWPLKDAQNRAGHDFFAKTRVVTAPAASR